MDETPTAPTQTGSILSGQIRTAVAAIAGAIALKYFHDASWGPLIGALLTVVGTGVWSAWEKWDAGKKVAAKVATALKLDPRTPVAVLEQVMKDPNLPTILTLPKGQAIAELATVAVQAQQLIAVDQAAAALH